MRIRSLRRGDVFYEVDHAIATRWVAIEDATKTNDVWRCACKRDTGDGEVCLDFCEVDRGHREPVLVTVADDSWWVI